MDNASKTFYDVGVNESMPVRLCLNSTATVHLGPADLAAVLGHQMIVLYVIVLVLLLLLWLYTSYYRYVSKGSSLLAAYLSMVPCILITMAPTILLSPSTIHLVVMFQDIITVSSMLAFIRISLQQIGGAPKILYDVEPESPRPPQTCPIGTPPLCCLLVCPRPPLTLRLVNLVLTPIKILFTLQIINLFINTALVYSGFPPEYQSPAYHNIQNFIIIPFFVMSMYTYKIFITISEHKMRGTFPKSRGLLGFYCFVVIKSTAGIVNILKERMWLPEIEGLPCDLMGDLFLPVFQFVLLLPPALILPNLYHKYNHILSDKEAREESRTPLNVTIIGSLTNNTVNPVDRAELTA